MVDEVLARGIASVAIPALGCGNGGLAWGDVRPLVEQACARMPDVRAVVFAPRLGAVLERLEGHYLIGVGDRSASVTEFAPINPLPDGGGVAHHLVGQHPDDLAGVEALLDLVEGFETPYSLELLATVHFAAVQDPRTADPAVLAERVAAWSLRKARMFTERHVRIAAARLQDHSLLL